MATIGSRRKPKAYKNRSTVRLTKANDIAFVSSSSSQFDLGGGNDYFCLWGNQNTVVTSGGIDQLSLVGNANIVRAQGSKLNSSAYFFGDKNYFFMILKSQISKSSRSFLMRGALRQLKAQT